MFPKSIMENIENVTPKLNSNIANGLATIHLKHAEEWLDSILKSTSNGFPKDIKYIGLKRCSPIEEYKELIKKKDKQFFDLARNDTYMVKLHFTYKDQPIEKNLYLLYVNDAAITHISGAKYTISPVLADRVISIENNNIFIKLIKAKIIFNREPYYYLANGVRENFHIAWSNLHNKKSKSTNKINSSLMLYLLCKYGLSETFKKFTNADILPFDKNDTKTFKELNETNNYVFCETVGIKPKDVKTKFYKPTDIVFAIKKDQYTKEVKLLIAGLFHILDVYPNRVKIEYLNNTTLWRTILGLLIWQEGVSEVKLLSDVNDHILSLDEYIDSIVAYKLSEINLSCNDIYEIFYTVIVNFDNWMLNADDRVNSMYDKEISILYYVYYNVIECINKLYFKLKQASKKELDYKKVTDIIRKSISTRAIYNINSNHGEVSTPSYSGDNKFFKITSMLTPQAATNRNNRNNKNNKADIGDPSKRLHVSISEVGSVIAMTKAEPTGRSNINPHIQIDNTGLILRNKNLEPLLNNIQNLIKR